MNYTNKSASRQLQLFACVPREGTWLIGSFGISSTLPIVRCTLGVSLKFRHIRIYTYRKLLE
ncbi:MAG: hypothetical protein IJN62_05775 [Clostridia bacterium]|nr:hypothetical protein [Clostridia bacterium]